MKGSSAAIMGGGEQDEPLLWRLTSLNSRLTCMIEGAKEGLSRGKEAVRR